MLQRQICLGVMLLLGAPAIAFGQNSPSVEEQVGAPNALNRQKKPVQKDPAATAAQRQTGLSEVQARSLLQEKGYGSVSGLQAQPNSIWVWQADAMKNGRRVRLGIDYRGNVLEISSGSARPCTSPGLSSGVSGFGVGTRLSEVTSCTGQ